MPYSWSVGLKPSTKGAGMLGDTYSWSVGLKPSTKGAGVLGDTCLHLSVKFILLV